MNRRTFLTTTGTLLGSGLATAATADSSSTQHTVEFHECTRATVSGTFTDGDLAYASTGWYDDAGYGNTRIEHGIEFGPDADNAIETPFEGTIYFDIGRFADLSVSDDTISVVVPGSNQDAVLTGLTTDPDDYLAASITHGNPHAEACLGERDGDPDEADFDVSITSTNTPVDAGEYLEVEARVENVGGVAGLQPIRLEVGDSREEVAYESVQLEPGEATTVTRGYTTPSVKNDQEFPVRITSDDMSSMRIVKVNGVGWSWSFPF